MADHSHCTSNRDNQPPPPTPLRPLPPDFGLHINPPSPLDLTLVFLFPYPFGVPRWWSAKPTVDWAPQKRGGEGGGRGRGRTFYVLEGHHPLPLDNRRPVLRPVATSKPPSAPFPPPSHPPPPFPALTVPDLPQCTPPPPTQGPTCALRGFWGDHKPQHGGGEGGPCSVHGPPKPPKYGRRGRGHFRPRLHSPRARRPFR